MPDHSLLNPSQRKAVESRDGHLLVLAGPGSGKTFVITKRIRHLIRTCGIPPEQILVITFTREAALSMQRRAVASSQESSAAIFGTFHSVFYSMLRQSLPNCIFHLLNPNTKRKLIRDVITRNDYFCGPLSGEALQEALEEFPKAMAAAKNLCSPEKGAEVMSRPFRQAFLPWMEAYDRERKAGHYLDYDDMVTDFLNLLREDPGIRKRWQRRFSHILIDEFQDINPAQYEVLRLLAPREGAGQVFAVGDDDQSIYGFRGSRPECLRRFERDYRADTVMLTENYRSLPAVIHAANRVIAGNRDRFFKEMVSGRREDAEGNFNLVSFPGAPDQYRYLEETLRKAAEEGQTVGVLFRTNLSMQAAAAYLSGKGLSFGMKESVSCIYDLDCLQILLSYLKVAEGMGEGDDYYRIINKPLRYINREALAGSGDPLRNAEHYYQSRSNLKNRLARLRELQGLRADLNFLRDHSFFLDIRYLLDKMHLKEEFLKDNPFGSPEELDQILTWFQEDAKGYHSLPDWLGAQTAYRKTLLESAGKQGRISLMTVHASKGLEFDLVCLPDCNEGMYPHGRLPDAGTVEEERRIFYVAMTRARNDLRILYLTGSRDRPKQRSRFLEGILGEGQ